MERMTGSQKPQAISLTAVKRALSEPRLAAYLRHPDEPLRAVLGRYRWNLALCMSLYPALGLLEVALRNNLHRALTDLHGTSAWYNSTSAFLTERGQKSVREAKEKLQDQNKPEDPDRLVAELTFGFWASFLSRDYERHLWPKLLIPAFPLMPKKDRTRSKVADRLKRIRWLRNRISHHEPIYRLEKPMELYDDLLEAISWLAPALLHMLPVGENFGDIYARGSVAYEIQNEGSELATQAPVQMSELRS